MKTIIIQVADAYLALLESAERKTEAAQALLGNLRDTLACFTGASSEDVQNEFEAARHWLSRGLPRDVAIEERLLLLRSTGWKRNAWSKPW